MFKLDYISDELKQIFNSTLGVKDYAEVSERTGYSTSTISNIIGQTTMVNRRTRVIVLELLSQSESVMRSDINKYNKYLERSNEIQKKYK